MNTEYAMVAAAKLRGAHAEITTLRALLAAQEARAQRVEQAARAMLADWDSFNSVIPKMEHLRAALSQHAAKESK